MDDSRKPGEEPARIVKSDAEWRSELSPEQYRIARSKSTEPAFTGKYWNHKEEGMYACVACGLPLFRSEAKYDSGSGWPSYKQPVEPAHVAEQNDTSLGMVRTEILCARCGAHLGHVFDDGPKPTGKRYCVNSASLDFGPAKEPGSRTGEAESEGKTVAKALFAAVRTSGGHDLPG